MEMDVLMAPLSFMIICLVLGAVLKSLLKNTHFPYTVALFCIGIAVGLLARGGYLSVFPAVESAIGYAGNADPDMILYVFLPLLIFDSAYGLDIHVFRKSLVNSGLLAGPGMVVAMFLTGALIMGLAGFVPGCEGWNWSFALMFGALISATDPVAVVALLKELGTSKRFSTLVDAESLLNDGTGIVLFMLFFGMYAPTGMLPVSPVLNFFIVVLGGGLLGWLVARLAISFLGRVRCDETVQNSVVIISSYITFILAQSYLHLSGVIALVAYGLTVSYVGKPRLRPDANRFTASFWELMAYMANTMVFIIVGIVIAMKVDLTLTNILLLLVVYVGINFIRAIVVFIFYPVMKKCGYGLSLRESVILIWGGLRGALGLTLALMVSYTLPIPEEIRSQILFFTAGIVTLTLTVNATTMRWLLVKLGLDRIPSAKQLLDYSLKRQMAEDAGAYLDDLKKREALAKADWKTVESFLPSKETVPVSSIGAKDILADMRLRVLNRERSVTWELYNDGIISNVSLRRLTASMDELYDQGGQKSLASRKPIYSYYNLALYKRMGRRLFRRWTNRFFCNWCIMGYDLARGFIIVEHRALALVDEFAQSDVLTPEEREKLKTLKEEIGVNIRSMQSEIDRLAVSYPSFYRSGVTQKAIRMLLAKEKRQIEELGKQGILSEKESCPMLDALDEQYASLSSYGLSKSFRVMDK